jgi:hypothetical protein
LKPERSGAYAPQPAMLIIRKEQIAVLSAEHDRQLAAHLVPKVLDAMPALRGALDEPTLTRVVREAVAQARGFGLETDQEVGELVGLVFVCGERFFERERYAWAAELLGSSSPTRVRQVSERVERQLEARLADERGGAR